MPYRDRKSNTNSAPKDAGALITLGNLSDALWKSKEEYGPVAAIQGLKAFFKIWKNTIMPESSAGAYFASPRISSESGKRKRL